jgi:hypothetical protein
MAQKTGATSRMLGRSRHHAAAHWSFWLLLLLFGATTSSASAQLILPTTCATVPVASFGVRLDLRYFYLLEYDDLGDDEMTLSHLDLSRFDQAIAAALVDELSDCDDDGNPRYGVLLSQHELSNKGGACLHGDDESSWFVPAHIVPALSSLSFDQTGSATPYRTRRFVKSSVGRRQF